MNEEVKWCKEGKLKLTIRLIYQITVLFEGVNLKCVLKTPEV